MASFTSVKTPQNFGLTFADVPFVGDKGFSVRMDQSAAEHIAGTIRQNTPQKHQPMADIVDEINRIIELDILQDFSYPQLRQSRNLNSLASLSQVSPERFQLNNQRLYHWYYPTGASRWSVFRGLATSTNTALMVSLTGGNRPAPFFMEANPISPSNPAFAPSEYSLLTEMFMLPPRPLAEHGDGFDGLYLITLVDERYWWQFLPIFTQPITDTTTWDSLIQQIAGIIGVTITYDSPIPAVYQTPEPDSHLWVNQESIASILDAVALNVGSVVVRNLSGSYSLLSPLDSLPIISNNRFNQTRGVSILSTSGSSTTDLSTVVRIAGGDIFNSGKKTNLLVGDLNASRNSVLPSCVDVAFPTYILDDVPHFNNPRYTAPRPSAWYEDSEGDMAFISVPISSGQGLYNSGVFLSGLTGVSGYVYMIHDTAKALFSGESSLSVSGVSALNQSGLQALATQLAFDYYAKQVGAALDEVYPGTAVWEPEGFHDIIWSYSLRQGMGTTRVMKTQWNQTVDRMQHSTPGPSGQLLQMIQTGKNSGNFVPIAYVPPGVGGPSVAQTIRDQFVSGNFGGMSGISQSFFATMNSGDLTVSLNAVDYFPVQNRWFAQADQEIMFMEAASGGMAASGGNAVQVVYRGVLGTPIQMHTGSLSYIGPNTVYGVNLITFEKGQFVYPAEWTSGGKQGIHVVPQIQTVECLDTTGMTLNGEKVYSGQVILFDTTQTGVAQQLLKEFCWIQERNGSTPTINNLYAGTYAGVSASGTVAPLYLFNVGGGSTTGVTSGYMICLADGNTHTFNFTNGLLTGTT